jgi:hypothetical protein
MNKRETVWLIVRLVGVYFLYSAVVTLFSLVGAISTLRTLSATTNGTKSPAANVQTAPPPVNPRPDLDQPAPHNADPAAEKLKSEAFNTILFYILILAIYGGIGFYLTRYGRMLFYVLSNENSPNKSEDNPAVTTLKL